MRQLNPFHLKVVGTPEAFCDRRTELDVLLDHARNGAHTLLVSPRRYGKTSLIAVAFKQLRSEGVTCILADLYRVDSAHTLVQTIAGALVTGLHWRPDKSIAERLAGLFRCILPQLTIGEKSVSLGFQYSVTQDELPPLDDVMGAIGRFARESGKQVCVAFDEFQEITALPRSKHIEGVMREHIQRQEGVSYIFAGSRRRILTQMFRERERPFFKLAFTLELSEIPREDFTEYIARRFAQTGKTCEKPAASRIYELSRGYPYYIQKLAFLAWGRAVTRCTESTVEEAHRTLLAMERGEFEAVWQGLSLVQKQVLRALAIEPTASPYAMSYVTRHQFGSTSGLRKALMALVDKDFVERDPKGGGYRLTDPYLAYWIREAPPRHIVLEEDRARG